MAAEGLSIEWYVNRHRDESELLPWAHLSAGLHHDFLWGDWQAALAEHGLEDCRWTPCYDCGVCTGYGLEHVVASPVAPAGGSQGTGQDLLTRGRGAGRARPAPARGRLVKVTVRYRKLGKVRFTSHRDAARLWERVAAQGGRAAGVQRGVHAAAEDQLRAGPADGGRVAGGVPRPGAGRGLRTRPRRARQSRSTRHCPPGFGVVAVRPHEPEIRSLQEAVTACRWEITLVDVAAGELRSAVEDARVAESLPVSRERKGQRCIDDVRPAIETLDAIVTDDGAVRLDAVVSTDGRGLRPDGARRGGARPTSAGRRRPGAAHPPMDRITRCPPRGHPPRGGGRRARLSRRAGRTSHDDHRTRQRDLSAGDACTARRRTCCAVDLARGRTGCRCGRAGRDLRRPTRRLQAEQPSAAGGARAAAAAARVGR